MTEDQFFKLIEYIDAAIADAKAGPEGLHESVAKLSTRQELYDSFFKGVEKTDENIGTNYIIKSIKDQNEIALGLMEETSDILCKMPGESLPDAARRVMKKYNEHIAFFENLLKPEQYGWAVNEDVRNEARMFLGIPRVKKKK
jgi:hypothetical protein